MIERLGKYRIVDTIGHGGMGTVYRAYDPVLGRQVALKVVSSEGELSVGQKARLLREAKACAQLTHPNVISIYDFGEDAGHLFIVMELLHGQDLKRLIAAHTTVSVVEKLALMIQVCDGLHYAHQQGIVHRDIKPANIFVLPNGQLKILDFGLAHITTSDSSLTQTGQILGTLAYMAPERFRSLSDHRADIFAVGAVCYELLTGRRAFVAETAVQLIEVIRTTHPPPLASMDASLPPELAAAVELALQKEPGARFADLGGMRTALDQVRQRLLNAVPSRTDVSPPAKDATLVERFATQCRRFRLAISLGFTVIAAIAIYFVNLPNYADMGASRIRSLMSQRQEAERQEAQRQEAQRQEAQRQEAQEQEAQRQETERLATAERERRQRQEELVAAARRGIEQARRRMVARREDAVKADAGRLAKSIFAAAENKQAEAETLVSHQSLSDADRRYQDATKLYSEAKVRAEAINEAKKLADGAKAQMLAEKQRASTAATEYAEALNEERQANVLYERSAYAEAEGKYRSTATLYGKANATSAPSKPPPPSPVRHRFPPPF